MTSAWWPASRATRIPARPNSRGSIWTIGAQWWRKRLAHYRCYFIAGNCIRAAHDIAADDDAEALAKANELILESDFPAVEVWQRTRFVGRHTIAADLKVIIGGRGAA
jgi:hypothetical protein